MTPTMLKLLVALKEASEGLTGRQIAHALWPDSPAWQKRTRGRSTSNHNGSLGGTMPMLGAKQGHRAVSLGYATVEYDAETGQPRFYRTFKGLLACEVAKPVFVPPPYDDAIY